MNVISCAVDDQCGCLHFADDASEVSKQVRAELSFNKRTPSLGAENQMQQDVARGMRHTSFAPAGASPSRPLSHGLRRGLHSYAALRLAHHDTDKGEQAVTTVTSIVVDLLWYDVPCI